MPSDSTSILEEAIEPRLSASVPRMYVRKKCTDIMSEVSGAAITLGSLSKCHVARIAANFPVVDSLCAPAHPQERLRHKMTKFGCLLQSEPEIVPGWIAEAKIECSDWLGMVIGLESRRDILAG
jgi:hypothetical protein